MSCIALDGGGGGGGGMTAKIMAGETIKTNLRSHSSSPRCIFGPTFLHTLLALL